MSGNTYEDEKEQADTVIGELRSHLTKVSSVISSLLTKVQTQQLNTTEGLSFFEMKNHTLLNYLIGVSRVVSCKANGRSLEDNPCVHALVEDRTVLERIRPLEQKLRYQIDKLLRIATTGELAEGDPLSLRARPDKMALPVVIVNKDDPADDLQDQITTAKIAKPSQKESVEVYVPPRLSAVPYDGDETVEEKRKRRLDAAKRRALTSSVMHELGSEYLDTPVEVRDFSDTYRNRATREEIERIRYEEDLMVRLPETKKERRRRNELTTDWSLGGELTRGADLSALDGKDTKNSGKKPSRSFKSRKFTGSIKRKGNKKPRFKL